MSEATEIASMGITTMIELMQARDEIKRLKEQLAKQEQGEPVGECITKGVIRWNKSYPEVGTKLYTTPQQRKPLTDEQIREIWKRWPHQVISGAIKATSFARAIEAAHGITKEQL